MKDWTSGKYGFKAPDDDCSRSPCPALNALANHNILPHSGRNMTFWQVLMAVREVYNLSLPLAVILTIGGFLFCGHRLGTRLDLHKLALHNKIEHNGSLAHEDAVHGQKWASCPVSHVLLDEMLREGLKEDSKDPDIKSGSEEHMTIHDLLEVRLRRLAQVESDRKVKLSKFHRVVMNGEAALILMAFGDKEGKVDREKLRIWFGEERLPDGWTSDVSGERIGLTHLNAIAGRLNKLVAEADKKQMKND